MRARDLADQTVGAQKPQQTGDPGGSTMAFWKVGARLGIKMSHQIAIAESLQDILAATDQRQKFLIDGRPRM
jgi:hypothetical protein